MSLLASQVFSLDKDVVFSHRINTAGLRAFMAGVFHKIHRCADLQQVQVFAQQAVAMKVKPTTIFRRNAAKGLVG